MTHLPAKRRDHSAQPPDKGTPAPKGRFSATAARLMAAILETGSIKAGAEKIHLSPRQASRICGQKIFGERWREQQRELTYLAGEIVKSEMCASIITLRELRDNPKVPASARLAAASKLLDLGVAHVQQEAQVEADRRKLEELKAALNSAPRVDEIDA